MTPGGVDTTPQVGLSGGTSARGADDLHGLRGRRLPAGTALLIIRRVAARALPGATLLRPHLVAILAAEHAAEPLDWRAIDAGDDTALCREVAAIVRRHVGRKGGGT